MTETTALKCPNCGATDTSKGIPFKNVSALNSHINFHCPKREDRSLTHEHKFMLLNANKTSYGKLKVQDHAIARAMNAGYTKICECGEVDK